MSFLRASIILLLLLFTNTAWATKPKLVVNIVVSQMRYDYLTRFGKNMSDDGFKKFVDDGMVFTDAVYSFMHTITPASLATITTGANPSIHGVVTESWVDYTTNQVEWLINDTDARGLDCDAGVGNYSSINLIVPTLGDRLKEHNPKSKVITIATNPVSAVVMGAHRGDVYWMDQGRGNWVSSIAYMPALPAWVNNYNALKIPSQYLDYDWRPVRAITQYVNRTYSIFNLEKSDDLRKITAIGVNSKKGGRDYAATLRTPVGNSLVAEFVKQAILYEDLGRDEHTDLLNICFDTPRYVGEIYGGESMEVEDMFYRLDQEIAELLTFINAQMDRDKVVVVLTSDHGSSDSYDYNEEVRERFNTTQFSVIVNGFMNSQFGAGDWVLHYGDRQLYINRNLVFKSGFSLEEIQNRVAAFALQFRGVSHVLTSTAMQNSSFHGGYAEKMQNSFYPKRSGDITINLMPGWIEEHNGVRASSGSMYEYDIHVPLMMLSSKIYGQQVHRTVDMRDLAPTLARMMQISRPIAAEGRPIEEAVSQFD